MTLIVAQKYINLPRSIALTCCAILALSGNGGSAKAAEVRSGNKTFAEWCREQDYLSPEAKHTVDMLLKIAGTTECDEGDRQLSNITGISFTKQGISDIKPLASLTNLKVLRLINCSISDIKALASLTNLTLLNLSSNQGKRILT